MAAAPSEIFLITAPGLEAALCAEAKEARFRNARLVAGGVACEGGWPEVWRANLELRGASRVLARIGSFRALHLAQLDKRARKFPWADYLRADVPVAVEASCSRSRIYHAGAAAERVARAIHEEFKAPIAEDAPVTVKLRIEDDLCTLSLDSSGSLLHKRGHKQAVAKAPMRESMAALFLRLCGYAGAEPVLDPMCGSGTFVIEAAEWALGLKPGRARAFAFEHLAGFDAAQWAAMRETAVLPTQYRFLGRDADAGAIRMSTENAARAGVAAVTDFTAGDIRDLAVPEGPPGLVILNPPYGTRIGDKRGLMALHVAMGQSLKRFAGWRVGLITADAAFAKATGLPFAPPSPPVSHGGLKVRLYQTGTIKG